MRHLVELHGGTVQAHSVGESEGATFTVTLPLPPSSPQSRPRRAGSFWPKPLSKAAEPSLADVRVLLVDDDEDTLQVLSVMLGDSGAKVQTASSAAAALEILQWYRPDVLVSDLAMPKEDGYSLISKIRSLETEREGRLPAVALTSHVRVEDRTRALSAGFNMFVPKPVEPTELIARLPTFPKQFKTKTGSLAFGL